MDGRRSRSMPWRSSPTGSWPGDVCADIEVLEEIKKARNLPLPPM
jgi:hypothetical protein